MDNGLRYALAFLLPLAGTLALTPVAARVARALGAMDSPAPNKIHPHATPYLGGLAVAGGLMLVAALTAGASGELVTILAGGLALFVLGLIDDWRTVSPATKILVEVGAAVALWLVGVRGGLFGSVLDLPLTVLWVVAVTNAFNLLDNMDGLLSGVAAVAALTFFVIAASRGDYLVAALSLAVAGAALGFLGHNFPPARIFMGDAGSLLLGFLLASIGLKLDLVGPTGLARIAIPALVCGVPLFDTALVVVARIREGRPPHVGGTDHSSHRLSARGLNGRGIALLTYSMQAVLSGIALWLVGASDGSVLIAVPTVAIAVLGMLAALLRAPAPERHRAGLT